MLKPEVTVKTKTNPFSSTNVKCQRSGPVIIIPCCWLPLQFPLGQWTSPRSWGLSLTPKGQTGALKRNSGSIIITMGTLVSWELFCVGLSGMSAVRFVLDPSEHLEHWQKGRWQGNCAVFCYVLCISNYITINYSKQTSSEMLLTAVSNCWLSVTVLRWREFNLFLLT